MTASAAALCSRPHGRRRRTGILEGAARCAPQIRELRCWFHKIANLLDALLKSAHPGAKAALAENWNTEDNTSRSNSVRRLVWGDVPEMAAKITDDLDVLSAFHNYPGER